VLVRVIVVLLVLGRGARAEAPCDPAEAADLRAHLTSQARNANTWNWAWRITFTGGAVGTLAFALADTFPELRDNFYVTSGKAAVGALARWFLPLHVEVPAENADVCADVAALRRALEKAAKRERSLFWTGHIGGILVNVGGAWIITERATLGKGLLSIAVGYPIGLLSNYTMPRGSWHRWRERTWTATVVPHRDGYIVSVGGAF
jgi:hypothetical protein